MINTHRLILIATLLMTSLYCSAIFGQDAKALKAEAESLVERNKKRIASIYKRFIDRPFSDIYRWRLEERSLLEYGKAIALANHQMNTIKNEVFIAWGPYSIQKWITGMKEELDRVESCFKRLTLKQRLEIGVGEKYVDSIDLLKVKSITKKYPFAVKAIYSGWLSGGIPFPNGECTFYYGDGRTATYVGTWKNARPDGNGTLTWCNGEKYVGQFENFLMVGQGTFSYTDGRKYVGQWEAGKKHGEGTLIYDQGMKVVGIFKNDVVDGYVMIIMPDGWVELGYWLQNKEGKIHFVEH